MNEHDPTNQEFINIPHLDRFKEDMQEVNIYFQLHVDCIKYLTKEFNIPEITSDGLDRTVERLLRDPEIKKYIPTPEFFDESPDKAVEQMRFVALRVAYPLAETFIEQDDQFTDWVIRTAQVVIDGHPSSHSVKDCLRSNSTYTEQEPFHCNTGEDCPVHYTRFLLLKDSIFLNLSSLDYEPEWREAKVRRNIAKLEAAHALGLTDDNYDETLRTNYLHACRGLGSMRKNTDI